MSEWQPIETAPGGGPDRRGPTILVYGQMTGVQFGNAYRYSDNEMSVSVTGFHGDWTVTHWMPLPEPPK